MRFFFFFQAEDGIRDGRVTGVQTCALPISLLAGNDLRNMTPDILEILTNREIIAVNQDKDGKQGRRITKSGDQEIWARPLSGGAQAIGLFNRGGTPAQITVKWSDLGLKSAPAH